MAKRLLRIRPGLLVALTFLCLGLVPRGASAAYVSCQTDPVVVLSNGASVDLTLQVSADASLVRVVDFTVYAPRGTTITAVQALDGGLGHVERVRLVDDQPEGSYAADTYVVTSAHDVSVTASAQMSNPDVEPLTATGTERQHLTIQLTS
jgi:hypothetical protein